MLINNILFVSGSDPTGSIQFISPKSSGGSNIISISSIKDSSINYKLHRSASSTIDLLFITSSGDNPRIGVGTTDPKSTFEFKEINDTTKGSELVLAGSRTTKGAVVGDSAGILNFAVPTGSANIIDSGSVGKIKGVVTNETAAGVQGKLVFEIFKDTYSSLDAIEFGYGLGNNTLTTTVMTGSLELKDTSVTGYSKLNMFDFSNNLTFEVLQGNITASGNISSSGEIIGSSGSFDYLDITLIDGGTF